MSEIALYRSRQDQRDIVGLLVTTDPVGDRASQHVADARQRLFAMGANQVQQTLLAKLSVLVLRLGQSIAEGDEDIAGMHGQAVFAVANAVKEPDHCARHFQAVDSSI